MSTTQVHARRLSVVAVAACGLVGLSACSGGSSSDAASSPSTTASSTLPTATTSSATSTSSSAAPSGSAAHSSSSAAGPSSTSSKSATSSSTAKSSKSTKAKPKPDPVAACKTANTKSNQAISQWNSAVSSQTKTKLDSAAHNFRTVAGSLRILPAKADNKSFTVRVKAVAGDLDTMAADRFAGKSVDPSKYNTDSETLRSFCQKILTSQ